MTQAPTFAPGLPIWCDLGSPNVAESLAFYGGLFGWTGEDLGEEAGHYTFLKHDGALVAAVGPLMGEQQPPAWSAYMGTNDAAATMDLVKANGGQVLVEPMQVFDQGKMAIFMDSGGGAFSVWQPEKMFGADKFNTPNSLGWTELLTRDMDRAKAFYTKVFPWTAQTNEVPGGMAYTEWQIGGRTIAGGMVMGDQFPPEAPQNWLVYFTVANADDIVKRAQELGGKVMAPAMDIPQGRIAVLTDPHGAAFGIFQLAAS
jgi:predicted enzyme related to lactoylglutathione lyase